MIKSISYDQNEILKNIMKLNNIERIDCDVTFGNGGFYKEIEAPWLCYDSDENVILDAKLPKDSVRGVGCSTNISLPDKSIRSLVFDPPFLTYVKSARNHNSIMASRFGGYWRYDELEDHYRKTINEAYRVLKKKGVMIFKCQDIIHNHKMHSTHINIIDWARDKFRLKDLFILLAKNRMPMPTKNAKQKHSRIYHSYFLVLERL